MLEVLKVAAVVVVGSVAAFALLTKLFIMFAQSVESSHSVNRSR